MIHWLGQIFEGEKRVGQLWNIGQYKYRAEIEIRNIFFDDSYESVIEKLSNLGYTVKD